MYRFMLDHPLVVIGAVVGAVLGWLFLFWLMVKHAKEDLWVWCDGCHRYSYLHNLKVNYGLWYCPYCGMDESGLTILERKKD